MVRAGQRLANYADNHAQATCQGGSSTGPHLHFTLLEGGFRQNLNDMEFSRWKVHSGNFSYDRNSQTMWLQKEDIFAYVPHDTISHLSGDNIIDYRYSGIYSSAQISGHGVNVSITELPIQNSELSRKVIFIAFYTYDDAGHANFYAGSVDYESWRVDETMNVDLFQTNGGDFSNLASVDFAEDVIHAGSMQLLFNGCSEVAILFTLLEPVSQQQVTHELTLSKSVGLPDYVCQAPSLQF